MSYGRFAVIIFIALSGFSLGLGLARSGWPFKSIATYAHRRPGASAALLGRVRIQSACDLVRARPARLGRAQLGSLSPCTACSERRLRGGRPNRAFWPIAIEARLYVLLPLLLLVRRVSARAMVGLVAAIVVTIGLLGSHVPLMKCAVWSNLNLFWLDCAATGDVSLAMAAAANRPGRRRRALAGR
jgi:peptidoglycan/LPS O-acetylase OafA/YrhL